MVLYLFIQNQPLGLGWWDWVTITIVGSIVVIAIDVKWIYPASQGYMFEKNPEWVAFREEFNEMKEMVHEIHRLRNK